MTTFAASRTKRYALEGAACVALLVAAPSFMGDLPTTGCRVRTSWPAASCSQLLTGRCPTHPQCNWGRSSGRGRRLGSQAGAFDAECGPRDREHGRCVHGSFEGPLFTTVVRLPEPVTSLAVGARTLIAAEHDKSEPRLVFLKPTTQKKIDSNA